MFLGLGGLLMIGTIGMPSKTQADIGDTELQTKIKISELAEGDILLQEVATCIAQVESGFVESAKNPLSTATGIYQFLIGTWKHYNCEGTRWNYEDNTTCALQVMKENGFSDWEASRWGKYGWWNKLSDEAKTYVKYYNAKPQPVELKKVAFAGGIVLINKLGDIVNNGKVWRGGEVIPHI